MLKTELIVAAILLLIFIAFSLKKNHLAVKYSMMWLTLPVVFVLMVIFSEPLYGLANFLGFELLSNFVFVVILGLCLLLSFGLTLIVSKQRKEITRLVQEISIIKKELNDKNK